MPIDLTPPPSGVYDWRLNYRLDGVAGAIRWRWSPAPELWTLTFMNAQGAVIAGPVPLAVGVDLLVQWRAYDVPPGELRVNFDDGATPGIADWGDRARLTYTSITELP